MNQSRLQRFVVLIVWFAGVLLVGDTPFADEVPQAASISAIQKLGGSARFVDGAWEVNFAIRGQRLTDADLVHITDLRPLTWLNLKGTQVTDKGLARLRNLQSLQVLNLAETAISDDGLNQLKALKNLEHLNVHGTRVSDRGLERLIECRKLRKLYVWKTSVTDAGVGRLQQQLPQLKVVRGVDLKTLKSKFPAEPPRGIPGTTLEWVSIQAREQAPERSENGINCEILFENRSAQPVKLYWIMYGSGDLKLYATLNPGATRRQNSYSQNAWLITDVSDRPLGYFVAKEEDSHAVIPKKE